MPAEKKQITRNRTSYSCVTCRRRKVKCDKVHPICGGCQKAGEKCVYGDVEKSGPDQDSTNNRINVDLPSRKRRATSPDIQPLQELDVPASAVEKIEQKLNHLTTLIHDFNRLTPVTNASSPDSVHVNGASNSLFRDEVSAYKNLYRTISGMGSSTERPQDRSDEDDSAPWNRIMGKLEHLNSMLLTGVRSNHHSSPVQLHTPNLLNLPSTSDKVYNFHMPGPSMQSKTDPNHTSTHKSNLSQDIADRDILAPSEQESNVLFRSWLWSTYPVYPMFSPHLILQKFTAFNKWYRTGLDFGVPNPDPAFMPFVYLIWYTGMLNISEKGLKHWFSWSGEKSKCIPKLRFLLERSLEGMKYEMSPSIYMVATAVIFHSMTLGAHDMMKNCTSVTMVIRMAQNLGLHIERPSKQLTEGEAETRRRLWWEAVHLDVSLSCASNMPVVMDECYTDIKMIKELKQSALGTNDALAYERHVVDGSQPDRPDDPSNNSTTSLVSIYHLVARARYELTVVTKRLLKANMTAEPMTMVEMRELRKSIVGIGKLIRATIDRIQTRGVPELDFVPESTPQPEYDHLEVMGETVTEEELDVFLREGAKCNFTTPISKHHRTAMIAFHKWARIYLSMLIDRLDCISYAPFLKNSKSRLWAVARNCALKSCHGFMRKFLGLAEDPQLPRFAWTWPCLFQPMHATVILLIDLHDRPHSDEATRSRAMIDKMFSLAAPYKGRLGVDLLQGPAKPAHIQDCRSEAWVMLRHLRRKAWQKAGLDPDVLWSEEDQIAVGVGKPLDENELFIRSLRKDIILNHRQRQARQSMGGKPLDEDGAKTLRNNTYFEEARRQYLHPSELGPGEQLSGPILQDLAELGIGKETSDVLLLRARHDQALMPFATGPDGREYVVPQNSEGESIIRNRNQNRPQEEGRIVHIGELIKKIQQTKQQSGAKPSQSAMLSEDNDILTNFSQNECDFRTIRATENAAFQDLIDAHSTSRVWPAPSAAPTTNGSSSTDPPFDVLNTARPEPSCEEPRFSFQPPPSPARFGVSPDDPEAGKSMSDQLTSHYYDQTVSIPEDSFSLAASIPPTLHNAGFTGRPDVPTTVSMHARDDPPAPTPPPSTSATIPTQSLETKPSEGGSVSIGGAYNADMEFDWERFDELFGHFGGFEDMLMDGGVVGFEEHADTGQTTLNAGQTNLPVIY